MRFAARILGFFLPFLFIFLFLKPSLAQNINYVNNQTQYHNPNTETNVPKNFHNYTQSVLIELLSSLTCQLSGIDPVSPNQKCLGINPKTNQIGFVENNGGMLGFISYGINIMYTPPLHTTDYLKYLGQNFGIAKPSYAQSVGFEALSPLIPIWSAFRNITYLLFIFVFVLIGIAIMLRTKIDPRTVMTIQNQIPKIVIALILIFFSYAIAGFLIDIMYIIIYLFFGVFYSIDIPAVKTAIESLSPAAIQGKNIINAAGDLRVFDMAYQVAISGKDSINTILNVQDAGDVAFVSDVIGMFSNLLSALSNWQTFSVFDFIYDAISVLSALKIAAMAASLAPTAFGFNWAGTAIGIVTGAAAFTFIETLLRDVLPFMLIFLIIIISVLVALFKVFFMLLKSYILIIFAVIFAPFWIAIGIMPGFSQGKGFGSWLRDIIANIAVFPAVYVMFLLANTISTAFTANSDTTLFSAPLLGNPLAPGFLGGIIGLGILLLTPEAGKMVRDWLKAPNLPVGGGGLRVGAAATGAIAGGVAGRMYRRDPRTGELKGLIGARLQSISLGNPNTQGDYNPTRFRKLVGFASKAPSAKDLGHKTYTQKVREEQEAARIRAEASAQTSKDSSAKEGSDTGTTS